MKIVISCYLLHIFISRTVYSQLFAPPSSKLSEDGRLLFPGLASKYGFNATEHDIITEDGYILTLFRIPGNSSKPVLLIHGNTPTGDCWIVRGNTSIAITLARRGYDVSVINLRGTRYSRKHVTLDPDKEPEKFFNYTFYEQAVHDVAATIDFVLNTTKQTKLTAIGHSVGTTLLYVLGAERPEYNDKIKVGISLAPISFIQNLRGLAAVGVALGPLIIFILRLLNIYEVLSYSFTTPILQAICLQPLGYTLCTQIGISAVLGKDLTSIGRDFQNTLFGHFPGGSTTKTFDHLIQVSRSKRFARYDYGASDNLNVYGSTEPPQFDLKKVTMKSVLFMGKEDFLGTVADAELLRDALPNVVHYEIFPYEKFNHADFIWGRYMPKIFYPYFLPVMEKYD